MTTHWHYRIVRHPDGNLSLCEVYYDGGTVVEIVKQPWFAAFTAGGETQDDIFKALRRALRDSRAKSILEENGAAASPSAVTRD